MKGKGQQAIRYDQECERRRNKKYNVNTRIVKANSYTQTVMKKKNMSCKVNRLQK